MKTNIKLVHKVSPAAFKLLMNENGERWVNSPEYTYLSPTEVTRKHLTLMLTKRMIDAPEQEIVRKRRKVS